MFVLLFRMYLTRSPKRQHSSSLYWKASKKGYDCTVYLISVEATSNSQLPEMNKYYPSLMKISNCWNPDMLVNQVLHPQINIHRTITNCAINALLMWHKAPIVTCPLRVPMCSKHLSDSLKSFASPFTKSFDKSRSVKLCNNKTNNPAEVGRKGGFELLGSFKDKLSICCRQF